LATGGSALDGTKNMKRNVLILYPSCKKWNELTKYGYTVALLFHYLMLNMFRMLIHPSSGACELFVQLFHGLYCSGSMCVGDTLWFGWGGVVSGCRLQPTSAYHTTTT